MPGGGEVQQCFCCAVGVENAAFGIDDKQRDWQAGKRDTCESTGQVRKGSLRGFPHHEHALATISQEMQAAVRGNLHIGSD